MLLTGCVYMCPTSVYNEACVPTSVMHVMNVVTCICYDDGLIRTHTRHLQYAGSTYLSSRKRNNVNNNMGY